MSFVPYVVRTRMIGERRWAFITFEWGVNAFVRNAQTFSKDDAAEVVRQMRDDSANAKWQFAALKLRPRVLNKKARAK